MRFTYLWALLDFLTKIRLVQVFKKNYRLAQCNDHKVLGKGALCMALSFMLYDYDHLGMEYSY